jgi:hypothetical protein
MGDLSLHPGLWLNDEADASLERFEADKGRISLNSAGRSVMEQKNLIWRWNSGGKYNRPPYLYQPADPPETSEHVKNGGQAIDTSEYIRLASQGDEYGWIQTHPTSDPVHFEYVKSRDRHLPGAPVVTPPVSTLPAGLRWYGIQEMLKDNDGYRGKIDNDPGVQTISAFQRFLNRSGYNAGEQDGIWGPDTGHAAQRWLGARWGYTGKIDNDYGPGTRAAWARAENANWKAFH